ncbi:MAG: SPOR domain-containing protein [Pseudomonadota bacterium]
MTKKTNKPASKPASRQTGRKETGGTLLGLVIGALLGLGAALAVAVYVTKVPVPFLNKSQPHSADNDAAEAKKNKDWDPNAPLAGKNPVRPVTPAAQPASAAAATAAAAPVAAPASTPAAPAVLAATKPVATPAATAVAPAAPVAANKPTASADPLGDLAKARSEAKPDAKPEPKPDAIAAAGGVDPFNYFIQVGAFRTPEDAEQQRAKLSLLGFQAKITEREQAGRTVFRVRLGPFDKKDDADKTKERLEGNAIETALVRAQR